MRFKFSRKFPDLNSQNPKPEHLTSKMEETKLSEISLQGVTHGKYALEAKELVIRRDGKLLLSIPYEGILNASTIKKYDVQLELHNKDLQDDEDELFGIKFHVPIDV